MDDLHPTRLINMVATATPHLDMELLRKAYFALNRNVARGVDGLAWEDYGTDLETRLADLHSRIHGGRYRPQPVRRVWIPKADCRQRPLGVTSVEDKLVQQALVWILETIYEADFKCTTLKKRLREFEVL